jgi:hypothetical protein
MTDRSHAVRDAFREAQRALSAANDTLSSCKSALHNAELAQAQAERLVNALQPCAQEEFLRNRAEAVP